jgi:hypothetical protein
LLLFAEIFDLYTRYDVYLTNPVEVSIEAVLQDHGEGRRRCATADFEMDGIAMKLSSQGRLYSMAQ